MKILRIRIPEIENSITEYTLKEDHDSKDVSQRIVKIHPDSPLVFDTLEGLAIIGSEIFKQSIITLS